MGSGIIFRSVPRGNDARPLICRRVYGLVLSDRDEGLLTVPEHAQERRSSGRHLSEFALCVGRRGDRFAPDADNHVTRAELRTCRGAALFDVGDERAARRLELQFARIGRRDILQPQTEAAAGGSTGIVTLAIARDVALAPVLAQGDGDGSLPPCLDDEG